MSAHKIYGVPEVKSKIVQNKSGSYDMSNVTSENLPTFDLKAGNNGEKTYYGVRVVNGSQLASGTSDKGIHIVLVGTDGCTEKLYLSGFFSVFGGVSSAQKYEDIVLQTDKNLGDVQVFIYGNDKNWTGLFNNEWFVEFSVVYPLSSKVNSTEFPCYHWIGDGETISTTSEATTLKNTKSDVLKKQRAYQIQERQKVYVWQKFPETGIPSGIDDTVKGIPSDENFGIMKNIDFLGGGLTAVAKIGDEVLKTKVDSLYDYAVLAEDLNPKKSPKELYESSRWVSDVEFGRQILNGINPIVIKRCNAIPAKFPVTDSMVQRFLTRRKKLSQEIIDGRVYICDLEIMDGLPPRKGCVAPAPICLLYVNSANQLVPIAIQIKQGLRDEEKKEPNPIFLPDDHWNDWLLAKIYYQAACAQFHQVSTHYFCCHAAMEAYAMGTMRNLPGAHPINKLLRPHFRYTMGINTRARKTLINKGGFIDINFSIGGEGKVQLFQRVSKYYSVDWTNIRKNTESRQVHDPNLLPGYLYRDDGYKVWDAMEKYISDIVNKFYSSDDDVKADVELQNFAGDIHVNGFNTTYGGPQGKGFPQVISTKKNLVEQCTRIMFTGSAQHASINFGQYQIYGYVPNAPLSVSISPPTKKGVTNYETLVDTLPNKTDAALGIVLTYTLSQHSQDEIFLGKFPAERFIEKDVKSFIKNFETELAAVEADLVARNKAINVPYTYMLPSGIPNSITI